MHKSLINVEAASPSDWILVLILVLDVVFSQVVVFAGRLVVVVFVVVALVSVAGAFAGVVVAAARGRARPRELGPLRARGRSAAHPPQLAGEAPPPAAGLANGTQEPDELRGLLPVRSSLAVAAPGALLVHGGQHLTDVGGQQVVHLITLQEAKTQKSI